MHWILQDHFISEPGRSALIAALDRFGISYSVHTVVPKVGELLPEPALTHQNVICIGSYSLRAAVAGNGWTPGLFDIFAQDFEQLRAHWGNHLLNFSSVVCPLKEAVFTEESMFVRPTNDSKYFSGRVFTRLEFAAWKRSICDSDSNHGTSLSPETRIQLSMPVTIFAEHRFWVVKGQLITHSVYKRGGQVTHSSDADQRLFQFVEERIGEWMPHETFVLDVCDTPDGIKIVEINTLNSSAFYAADVQRLVMALEDAYTQ